MVEARATPDEDLPADEDNVRLPGDGHTVLSHQQDTYVPIPRISWPPPASPKEADTVLGIATCRTCSGPAASRPARPPGGHRSEPCLARELVVVGEVVDELAGLQPRAAVAPKQVLDAAHGRPEDVELILVVRADLLPLPPLEIGYDNALLKVRPVPDHHGRCWWLAVEAPAARDATGASHVPWRTTLTMTVCLRVRKRNEGYAGTVACHGRHLELKAPAHPVPSFFAGGDSFTSGLKPRRAERWALVVDHVGRRAGSWLQALTASFGSFGLIDGAPAHGSAPPQHNSPQPLWACWEAPWEDVLRPDCPFLTLRLAMVSALMVNTAGTRG